MWRFIVAATLAILAIPASVKAACPEAHRLIRAEYFNSDAVVEARLSKIAHEFPKHEQDYFIYTLQTSRTIQGTMPSAFEVYEENSSGRAGFDWKRNTFYLLFVKRIEGTPRWYVDGCGNSDELSAGARTRKIVESLKTSTRKPVIEGKILLDGHYGLAEGVAIEVTGAVGSFKASTDKTGFFRVEVPRGKYEVKARLRGWSIKPDVLTYEDPRSVTLKTGSAAQVQFYGKLAP